MRVIKIKRGKDIPLKGEAKKHIEDNVQPQSTAVNPGDFCGLKARVLVKEGGAVKQGTPVIENKNDRRIKVVSPVSGCIREIRRGDKRRLLDIVIENDFRQEYVPCTKFSPVQIPELSRGQIIAHLLETGSWAFIRQRPFDGVASPDDSPKSIFIKAMDTSPLAPDYDVLLQGQDEMFQTGLELIQALTDGMVYLCCSVNAQSPLFTEAQKQAQVVFFEGPHPAGNVGTHIHYLDPIDKKDVVWYLDACDVAAIGKSFLDGCYCPERVVAVTGENAPKQVYQKTIRGAAVPAIAGMPFCEDTRIISGNVLTGRDAGKQGFLGFYDSQISFIPGGGKREFLGWTMPGLKKFSFSRTFLSSIGKNHDTVIDTDTHGSLRAVVFNDVYDKYTALDVLTFFLIRAIFAGDIDEMERLGILECSPEDFALAQVACPSKTDVCAMIRQGLEMVRENQE